jgi:hypothetical protein
MKNLLLAVVLTIISTFVYSQTDVLPPLLDKPANAATNQMPDVQLDWYAVNGIGQVSYTLEVDTSDLFPTPVTYSTIYTAQKAENLMFGGVYFWRVKATDNTGTSNWSEIRNFTVFSFVALHLPTNGNTGQMPNVVVDWSNKKGPTYISGLTYYDVELSLTDDFMAPYLVDSVKFGSLPSNANYYTLQTSNLLFDTTYYWRVRARHDMDASDWSEVWSFVTKAGVTLTAPTNGAVNQSPDVVLTWEAMTGIISFVYQVCTDPNFTFPCITNFTESNTVTVPSLLFGATYHWRVRAAHLLDTTNWSNEFHFQIINTVLLSTPANGAVGVNTLPILSWNNIAGADQYELRWNNSDNTIVDTAIITVPSFQMYKPLEMNEDYYWKVRAINNVDTTNWSDVWQFHTGPQAVGDISLQKNEYRVFPNPSNGELSIEFNSLQTTNVQVTILDFVGKTVFDNTYSFQQGLDKKSADLRQLNDGLYFIRFKSGDKVYSEKLIISK